MKILHQLGHRKNWNVEAFFENGIGDGFVLHAYSFDADSVGGKLCGHPPEEYMQKSFLDLQFYGGRGSTGGKLSSYAFHPINDAGGEATSISTIEAAMAGVEFQEKKGFGSVIIPHVYHHDQGSDNTVDIVNRMNKFLKKNKKNGVRYYMTLPFSGTEIRNIQRIEAILAAATDMEICFDGYYVVCEPNLETRKKISIDPAYYKNLIRVITTLKKQGFDVIHGFANIDSAVFSAIANPDYVTIGTYEVLRNFNIKRFTSEDAAGGPSKGWYFSEKLLNFVRAQELDLIRLNDGMGLIANEDNIFSDAILMEDYAWNTHRAEVHKNYLVAMSKMLKTLEALDNKQSRAQFLLQRINTAQDIYRKLEEKNIYLSDEASGYHLNLWKSILSEHLAR